MRRVFCVAPLLVCSAAGLRRGGRSDSGTLSEISRTRQPAGAERLEGHTLLMRASREDEAQLGGGARWTPHGWVVKPSGQETAYFNMHIPKTAGCSLSVDAPKVLANGTGYWSLETCFGGELPQISGRRALMAVFREPVAHVYSQYLECKHDPWFQGRIAEEDRHNLENVTTWLQHFQGDERFKDFGCFNPYNMQTRALTCVGNSHHLMSDQVLHMDAAMRSFDELSFVGLVEHYQATLCLLHARSHDRRARLPAFCDCGNRTAWSSFRGRRESHGVPPHSPDDLSREDRGMIDSLTQLDQQVYERAKRRFMQEVRAVERAKRVRLVC